MLPALVSFLTTEDAALGADTPVLRVVLDTGLLSVTDAFARMLLHGGALDGDRFLKPETFMAMTTDRIGPGSDLRDHYPWWAQRIRWQAEADDTEKSAERAFEAVVKPRGPT
jgi:hypothetical protein